MKSIKTNNYYGVLGCFSACVLSLGVTLNTSYAGLEDEIFASPNDPLWAEYKARNTNLNPLNLHLSEEAEKYKNMAYKLETSTNQHNEPTFNLVLREPKGNCQSGLPGAIFYSYWGSHELTLKIFGNDTNYGVFAVNGPYLIPVGTERGLCLNQVGVNCHLIKEIKNDHLIFSIFIQKDSHFQLIWEQGFDLPKRMEITAIRPAGDMTYCK